MKNVKNEKIGSIEIKNNLMIPGVTNPFVCLRNGYANTTDLDSNPFITRTSSSSILSLEKKHFQLQTKVEDDDIEVKKEITFFFTIIGWQDTTTGVGKKYEKIVEENITIDNVGLEVEVDVEIEVEVEVEVEKKSKRKSFGNNNFNTILKRNSTDKKVTRLSCLPQEKNTKLLKNEENINISNISIIEIHCVNEETKMSILFEYKIYTVLLPYLLNDWLEPGKEIEVYYGLITEIDKSHDFVRILRSEHTIVKEKCNTIHNYYEQLSSEIRTNDKSCNVNNNALHNKKNRNNDIIKMKIKNSYNNYINDNKENKKENYNKKIESSDMSKNYSKNDNSNANDKNDTFTKTVQHRNSNKDKIENNDKNISDSTLILQRMFRNNILENDRNRYDALVQNKTEFQNVPSNTIESCFRHRINNAYVLIKTDTNKLNQNLAPSENMYGVSSLKRTDDTETNDTGISGMSGSELNIKEVSQENCKENSMGEMMTCESNGVVQESDEQQQQQQQQEQHKIQSLPQVNGKKRILDRSMPCDNNIIPDSTESYRPYREEFVTLTVSKGNKTEIMEIEYSLLPNELQHDFQQVGKINRNEDNHVNDCRMYDIVFARTWTSSSSMSSSSEYNIKRSNDSTNMQSKAVTTSAIDYSKTIRESLTSSEIQNFDKKGSSPNWKMIWMKQKML